MVIMRQPIVVFTIDDGLMTDYTKVYPIFKRRGLSATSYVVGGFPDENNIAYMSWEYIKTLQRSGWDIQDHSFTHRQMSTLTESELQEEVNGNNRVFSENEIGSTQHHAYPYGSNNTLTKDVFSKNRKTARLIGNTWTTYDEIKNNPYNIKACNMDIQDEAKLNSVKTTIDHASLNEQGVVVLFFHNVRENAQVSVQEGFLEDVIDYVIGKGIRVMTFNEMYDYVTAN